MSFPRDVFAPLYAAAPSMVAYSTQSAVLFPSRNGSLADVEALHSAFGNMGSACVNAVWATALVLVVMEAICIGLRDLRVEDAIVWAIRALEGVTRDYPSLVAPAGIIASAFRFLRRLVLRVLSTVVVVLVLVAFCVMGIGPVTGPASEHSTTEQLDSGPPSLPRCGVRHIAVIMDGNRRFGRAHCGSALLGHRVGGEKLREFIRWCRELGIEMATVYAFSTENWRRTPVEVDTLMSLFAAFFDQIIADAQEIGICVRYICSDPQLLPPDIVALMRRVEVATEPHLGAGGIVVNVCVSYGSRSAVGRACRDMANLQCPVDNIDGTLMGLLSRSLTEVESGASEAGAPRIAELWGRPDLLLRTSGEQRLSNFMLLELAYAEMFFLPVTWPEITREMLHQVIREFTSERDRRLGK